MSAATASPRQGPSHQAPPRQAPPRQAPPANSKPDGKIEPKILFQTYFKSPGPRTYAAQVKEASNGNHFLVLTESKRDKNSDEPRKTRLFVFSEDFPAFFDLVQQAAEHVRKNPVPEEVRKRQENYWKKGSNRSNPRQARSAPGKFARSNQED